MKRPLDFEYVKRERDDLYKAVKSGQPSANVIAHLTALRRRVIVSEKLLRDTKIGKLVNKVKLHKDPAVAKVAAGLVSQWKQEMQKQRLGQGQKSNVVVEKPVRLQPFPIMKLPFEIRRQIYGAILPRNQLIQLPKTKAENDAQHDSSEALLPAILYTSMEVFNETIPIYLEQNFPVVERPAQCIQFDDFLRANNLHSHVWTLCLPNEGSKPSRQASAKMVKSLTNLKELRMFWDHAGCFLNSYSVKKMRFRPNNQLRICIRLESMKVVKLLSKKGTETKTQVKLVQEWLNKETKGRVKLMVFTNSQLGDALDAEEGNGRDKEDDDGPEKSGSDVQLTAGAPHICL